MNRRDLQLVSSPFSRDLLLEQSNTDIEMDILEAEKVLDDFEFKRSPIMRFYQYLGMTGAEWNYSVGVPLNYTATYSTLIPPDAGLGIALGWNYVDAVYSIGLGTLQLLDEEDYRQTQNKIKGVFNIISGVQLFLLSYNPYLTALLGLTGGAALAAPSFALAMACDLVTASIDFYNANKEVEFEGWLEERAKEINYNKNRIEKLSNQKSELEALELKEGKDPRRSEEIYYLKAKIRSLEEKNNHIQKNIYARSRVYCQDKTNEKTSITRRNRVKAILNKYDPVDKNLLVERNAKFDAELWKPATSRDIKINNDIQSDLEKNYKENRLNLFIKTASFVGMTLLAVSAFVSCPPVLLVGLAITSMVAAYYIYKNGGNIMNAISKFGLFGGEDKTPKLVIDKPFNHSY